METQKTKTEAQSAGIRKALGLGEEVTFQDQVWRLEPLTFLDLADAEAFGLLKAQDVESLTTTSVLWLMLRKADPSLTDTQRDLCQYVLTPREVRNLFGLQGDAGEAGVEFMTKVMAVSGLSATEAETAEKETSPPKDQPAKKARGGRQYKPETPATPTAE